MNSIFFDPEKVSPEINALSLLLKESFYLWTPLVYIIFDSRFYSIFNVNEKKKFIRLVNKEIEENTKSFHKNIHERGDMNQISNNKSSKRLISSL